MTVEDMFNLEVRGISTTIRSYSVEKYILSYSDQLQDLQLPRDYERITEITDRLLEWYNKNFTTITNSRFVMNKEEHIKTRKLLQELQNELRFYKAD